jgi:2-desacetyl-2-hydroxyethyl bacteriochlorophyllide A dehydrogenase
MKAVLFENGSQTRVVEVPDPIVGDQDVLIQVGACGICASDLHLKEIKAGITELPYPFVAGHEMAGTVVEIGAAVKDVRVGDQVVVHPVVYCGRCRFCRNGYANLCRDPQIIGSHRSGGFAEYVACPAQNAYVSGDLPDGVAACTEPLACALHGLVRLDPRMGDHVLIFGVGGIGLFFLQLVRNRGAGRITAVDLHPHRLKVARQLGAEHTVLADGNQEAALAELAPLGFDCVVDATGVPAVVEATFRHVAHTGKLLMLGSCPSAAEITIRPRMVQSRDATVVGAFGFNYQFAPALQLLQEGRVQVDPIVTHHYPLEDFAAAFEQARSGKEGIKIHIVPK